MARSRQNFKKKLPRRRKEKPPSKRAHVRALNRIRSVVGAAILQEAAGRYGEKKINDVAKVLARELSDKKKKELRKQRRHRELLPLTDLDKARHKVVKEINYRQKGELEFFRRQDGRYNKFKNGKRLGVVSKKVAARYESMRSYRKLVRLTKSTFDITSKEARNLIKSVGDQSLRKLRAFKKTKRYQKFSKRRKRRYSIKRTRINALMRLAFLITGEYDITDYRLERDKDD